MDNQDQNADVFTIYTRLLADGYTKKDAAKEAQARTGQSAVTGRKINKTLDFSRKGVTYGGQYTKLK